jgi:nitrogen fixation NifU-like protein
MNDNLYKTVILEHYRHPCNRGDIPEAWPAQCTENPSCGDRIELGLDIRDGRIHDVRFDGVGCAVSLASCSIMTEKIKGQTCAAACEMADRFLAFLNGGDEVEDDELRAFEQVRRYPSRIKCASLAWQTVKKLAE